MHQSVGWIWTAIAGLLALGAVAEPGTFDAGGGAQSSANYTNHGSIGGSAVGISTVAPSYVNYAGFVLAVFENDSDKDGLPDGWENLHFGNLDSTGADDNDRDTVNNDDELAAGSDPTDPDSFPGTPVDYAGIQLTRGWQLIAFRALPDYDPEAGTIIDAQGSPADVAVWTWNGRRLVQAQQIRLQTGYWVYAPQAVELPSVTRPQLSYTPLPLLAGWNLVGFNEAVSVDDFATEHQPLLSQAFYFANRRYRRLKDRPAPDQNVFSPEVGYWLRADDASLLNPAIVPNRR